MGMVNRRKRTRISEPETLTAAWNRGEPPPAWAYKPGKHHEELFELCMLGPVEGLMTYQQPHLAAWRQAEQESRP